MHKAILFPCLLVVGCLFCGAYGALHNQISYTVSPDYFHAFKFRQFRIPAELQNRAGGALVGWSASWWMGLLIGVPLLSGGVLALPDAASFWRGSLLAFATVASTALLVGLAALAVGCLTLDAGSLPSFWLPDEPIDRAAFARAGMMHNFSYLGGFLGIFTGFIFLAYERYRLLRLAAESEANPETPATS